MINAFKYGLQMGVKQWRTALIAYFLQLLIVVPLGFQVYQVLEASIGNSLGLNKLMSGFNDTVVTDFFNVHGASLSPLLGQLRWVLLIYLIVSVFINAGLLNAVVKEKKGWFVFWEGGAGYFFRFLKVALFFLLIAGIWTGVIWVPFMGFFQTSPEVFSSEKISVLMLFAVLFIYFIVLVFLFNWSVIARIKIMTAELKIGQALKEGFVFSVRNYFSIMGLFLLFLFIQLIFMAIYWNIESASGMISPVLVLVFFILQQLLIYSRWVFKIGIYGGVKDMCS